jgi:hypothetical protein
MVGLNLLMVGAVAETHLGDAPARTASPSEGTDFAGLLETMLPTGEFWTPDGSETPRVPDADATLAQIATLGLMTLPITPMLEPATEATFPTQTPEPTMRFAGADRAYRLQESTPFPLEPTMAQGATPKFDLEPTLGDGRGESDFPKTRPAASESLLAVEGDAPPAAARQAAPPPPPTFAAAQATATPSNSMPDARAESSPAERTAPLTLPTLSHSEPPTPVGELSAPHGEPPAPLQETRLPHGHAVAPTTPHAAPVAENATPLQPAEPNWGAAEQIAQHIERMVYERERNRLTVRLDPPELGVVELRIQATGSEVQAWLTAERDLTRQMLQQAQQYLREQLESRGLQLTHFDVGGQSQFRYAPREQHTRYATLTEFTRTPTATDSLLHDGRWSVWV